jgi:hypothetical protein
MSTTMASVLSPPAVGGERKSLSAPKKEIWSSLLNSVSSGKRLAEKELLVLGKNQCCVGFDLSNHAKEVHLNHSASSSRL